MSACSKHHLELDENGEGRCSVPMWQGGCPAGFCDEVAYGPPTKAKWFRDRDGRLRRMDGKYEGYVPGLACKAHGGPGHRVHFGDPCKYCGTPHDDVQPGPCPGRGPMNPIEQIRRFNGGGLSSKWQDAVEKAIIDLDRRVREHEDNIQDLTRQLNICGSMEKFAQAERGKQPKATEDALIEKFSKRIHDRVTESEDADVRPESFDDILRLFAEECRK